jgi:DNA polymerase
MKLEVLKEKCTSCVKCTLSTTRNNVVFGRGNPNSDLFVIGEGPGQQEDALGLAFVGRSGKMLDDIFLSAGLIQIKIAIFLILLNVDLPDNRKPSINEVSECMPWLTQQIDLIKPNIIVLAGSTAVDSYLGIKEPISQLRGRWIIKEDIKYMPIFHPSYLLRNPSSEKGKPKWLTVKDIKKVKKEL